MPETGSGYLIVEKGRKNILKFLGCERNTHHGIHSCSTINVFKGGVRLARDANHEHTFLLCFGSQVMDDVVPFWMRVDTVGWDHIRGGVSGNSMACAAVVALCTPLPQKCRMMPIITEQDGSVFSIRTLRLWSMTPNNGVVAMIGPFPGSHLLAFYCMGFTLAMRLHPDI